MLIAVAVKDLRVIEGVVIRVNRVVGMRGGICRVVSRVELWNVHVRYALLAKAGSSLESWRGSFAQSPSLFTSIH